jgi:RNA polymerase sigma-70 factor (ECF subfamily)
VAKAENLKPYLFRMARNVAINKMKRNQRRRDRDQESSAWLVADESSSGFAAERSEVIQTALGKLPTTQRAVIVMKFFRAKSFREIGELMGISENTAGSRYRYGMDKLRALVREVGR